MSKTIGNDLKNHLAEDLTTVATCWRIARVDGVEFFFTDHDVDLTIDDDVYEASSGMMPSALSQNKTLAVDNMEVVAFLESLKIDEADLVAGLFDYAQVDIFVVNYADLTMGVLYLVMTWKLGAVEIRDNTFRGEIRGITQQLSQNIVDIYSPDCRADLGDSSCGVDLVDSAETFWTTGAVTVATDRRNFTDAGQIQASGVGDIYQFGKLVWMEPSSGDSFTGNNALFEMEIKKFDPDTGEFELFESMPYAIEVGDEYTITQGCDKSKATCRDRFNNVVNFRGEPFIPGFDRILDVATSR